MRTEQLRTREGLIIIMPLNKIHDESFHQKYVVNIKTLIISGIFLRQGKELLQRKRS